MIAHETYAGTGPKRLEEPLTCGCDGRCEPKGEETRIGHSGRCAKKLNSYSQPNAGRGDGKFAICSPCMRRLIELGVDLITLKAKPPAEPKPERRGRETVPRLPGLRREMESRNILARELVGAIPILENVDHVYKLRQRRRGTNPALTRALAEAIKCKVDDLQRGDEDE